MLATIEKPEEKTFKPIHYSREKHLREYWIHLSDKGRDLYSKGFHQKAIDSFGESLYISKVLIYTLPKHNMDNSGLELYYISCHNLAACCNSANQATKGENVLRESYEQILDICEDKSQSLYIRLEALSLLDKSLFSLSSQLAYMCKVDRLHPLIEETAIIAERIGKELGVGTKENYCVANDH